MTDKERAKFYNIVQDLQDVVGKLRALQNEYCNSCYECKDPCDMYRRGEGFECFFDKPIIKVQKAIKNLHNRMKVED